MRFCGGWLAVKVKNLGRIFFCLRRQHLAGGGWRRLAVFGGVCWRRVGGVLGGLGLRRAAAFYGVWCLRPCGGWSACMAAAFGGVSRGLWRAAAWRVGGR